MRWRLQPYVTEAATYVIKAAAKVERDRLARLYGLGGDGAQRRLGERSEERDGVEGVAGTHHVDAWRAAVGHDRLQQLAVRTAPVRLVLVGLFAGGNRLERGPAAGRRLKTIGPHLVDEIDAGHSAKALLVVSLPEVGASREAC